MTLKLQSQLTAWGLVGEAAERSGLAQLGASESALAPVDALIGRLTALKQADEYVGSGLNIFEQHADKIRNLSERVAEGTEDWTKEIAKLNLELAKTSQNRIKSVIEGAATPLAKFVAQVRELDQLGIKGFDPTAYASEIAKDFDAIRGASVFATHAPGAALEDSTEAYSQVVQFNREQQAGAGDVQEQVKNLLEQIKEQERVHTEYARRVAEAIEHLKIGKFCYGSGVGA